jgi:hypothetical protein
MTLGAEVAGMLWALSLFTRGPRLLRADAAMAEATAPLSLPAGGNGA